MANNVSVASTTTYVFAGKTLHSATASINTNGIVAFDDDIVAGAANTAIAGAALVANMQFVFLKAAVDMTLKTNNSGSPGNTISLKAGIPIVWDSTQPSNNTNPFTVDVTSFFATNATSTTAELMIYIARKAT